MFDGRTAAAMHTPRWLECDLSKLAKECGANATAHLDLGESYAPTVEQFLKEKKLKAEEFAGRELLLVPTEAIDVKIVLLMPVYGKQTFPMLGRNVLVSRPEDAGNGIDLGDARMPNAEA